MAIVNFSVPDDVKEAFNRTFAGENKSAIIAQLMREAVERAERRERSRMAIGKILALRASAPSKTPAELEAARKAGRP